MRWVDVQHVRVGWKLVTQAHEVNGGTASHPRGGSCFIFVNLSAFTACIPCLASPLCIVNSMNVETDMNLCRKRWPVTHILFNSSRLRQEMWTGVKNF